MQRKTKKIVIIAMLVAFDVIFTRVLAVNIQMAKIGLGFAAVGVCAMLYGPLWAALCAALGDVVGALLFPTGAFFPGFTATAAVSGLIFGLFLYKQKPNLKHCFFAAFCDCALVTLLANTLMISWLYSPDFVPLLVTRSIEAGIMLVAETAVMAAIGTSDTLYGKILELRE